MYGRQDGLGQSMFHLVSAMALATGNGMNFGGLLRGGHTSHDVDFVKTVLGMFNVSSTSRTKFFPDIEPKFDATFNDPKELVKKIGSLKPGSNVLLDKKSFMGQTVGLDGLVGWNTPVLDSYLTPEFLQTLRAQIRPNLLQRPLVWQHLGGASGSSTGNAVVAGGVAGLAAIVEADDSDDGDRPLGGSKKWQRTPRVALHLRRGDIIRDDVYTPDWWYLMIVHHVRETFPDAEVHAWSTEGKEGPKEFDPLRKKNITVHLDGDPLDAWANMASADVMVMAKSAFSTIPGLLSTKCVIYESFYHKRLRSWLVGSDHKRANFEKQLHTCLARTGLLPVSAGA